MADSGGSIQLVRAEQRRHTCAGIEEIPFLIIVDDLRTGLIVPSVNRIADVPILQVGIGRQPGNRLIFSAKECAGFLLDARVPVPGIIVVHRRIVEILAQQTRPEHLAPVAADIAGQVHAAIDLQGSRPVTQVGLEDVQVIVHLLPVDHVALLLALPIGERIAELGELPPGLVVLVVAVTPGIIRHGGPGKRIRQLAGVVQLQMVLGVVVGLVRVIAGIPVVIDILPRPVVATVHRVRLRVDAIPCNPALLVAHQIGQSQGVTAFQPAQDGEQRGGFHAGVPDIAVGPAGRIRQAEVQARRQQAGSTGD